MEPTTTTYATIAKRQPVPSTSRAMLPLPPPPSKPQQEADTEIYQSTTNSTSVHPLLLEVILEKVLKYSHSQQNIKHFASLRSVCKLWNTEVTQILRQTHEFPMSRLFTLYPNGLGFKYHLQNNSECFFRCPFPETLIFESLKVVGLCKNVRDVKALRFLAVYGHHIKSLHYVCSLYCSHQVNFLLNVLHCWCPNLETLYISNIHRLSALFNVAKWTAGQAFNLKFNCKNLKTLILSVDCPAECNLEFSNCENELDSEFSDRIYYFIHILRVAHRDFHDIKNKLPPPPPSAMIDNSMRFFNLIQSRIEKSLSGSNLKHFMYLGTLGHILKFAPLQKLVVKQLDNVDESRSLAFFLLHHPNKPLTTLRHLEFGPDILIGKDYPSLLALSIPKTGIRVFHFDNIASSRKSLESLRRILENCREFVRDLRLGNNCACCAFKRTIMEFPKMPNLRKLAIKHVNCFSIDGHTLLRCAPKLERLELYRDENQVGSFDDVFLRGFCANFGNDDEREARGDYRMFSLRELKYDGYLSAQNIAELCSKWLGNLARVELFVDCVANLEKLVRCIGGKWEKLEDLRLTVGIPSRSVYRREMDRCIRVLREDLRELQSLKFLDLTFRFRRRKIVLPLHVFREGIGRMKGLRSLKLTNFRIFYLDKEEIEGYTSHITSVSFMDMDYI